MPAPPNIAPDTSIAGATPPQTTSPTLTCDWEEWADYLADIDAPDAQKRQMIETLWTIVLEFVDLGWDVTGGESCGQSLDLKQALEAAVLYSEEHTTEEEV